MNKITPVNVPADDLDGIADRIRARIRSSVIDVGRDLVAVKERLDHGDFLNWIDREFGMTARSAQNYMQAAQFAEGKCETVSHLPPKLLYRLSAPSIPEPIKTEIVAEIEAGRGHKAVEALLDKAEEHQRGVRSLAARKKREAKKKLSPEERQKIEAEAEQQTQKMEVERAEYQRAQEKAGIELVGILGKLPDKESARLRELLATYDPRSWLCRLLKDERMAA